MTTKHTPGPWAVDPDDSDYVIDATGNHVCAMHACFSASTVDCGSRQDREANAHLIAAAPDLLEMLELMAAQHRCGCRHPACKRCADDDECTAAIAKAKGEKP